MGACQGTIKDGHVSSAQEANDSPAVSPTRSEEKREEVYKAPSEDPPPLPGGSSKVNVEKALQENIKRKKLIQRRNVQGERFDVDEVMGRSFQPKHIKKSAADAAAIRESLHGHFLFSNLTPKQLEVVVDAMELEEIRAGQTLIEEGTQGDKFYVVKSGQFDVVIGTLSTGSFSLKSGKVVKTLGAGSNFGELALMYGCPRTATIHTKTDATVFALDRHTFKTNILVSGETETRSQIATLKAVEVFANLRTDILDTISRAMLRVNFEKGAAVIEEGQEGSVFYIIESGELECTIKGKFIRTMEAGAFFGERALLKNEPRSATIVAKSECVLLAMEREDFETLLGPLEHLQQQMDKVHNQRIHTQAPERNAVSDDADNADDGAYRKSFRAVPISDLVIIKDVGRGAFGRVKVVRHKASHQLYALKVMQKDVIVRTKNALQVLREKKLLNLVQPHPLIVQLVSSMQDKNCLYLLQEFINGGDLFHRLYNIEGVFPSSTARYYAACVTLMLEKLHNMSILYRDLKPENLLLNAQGVLKMVDFGMAKKVLGRTYTLCGTPEYMAPEVIHSVGHSKGVDYWALGVLVFEMICGDSPFEDPNNNHLNVYKNIELGKLNFPHWLEDKGGIDLIRRLLVKSQTKRLGCLKGGSDDIKGHPWFRSISFDSILDGSAQPPIVPQMKNDLDTSNFYPIDSDNRIVTYVKTGKAYEKEWEKEF